MNIALSRDFTTIVDDEDFPELSKYKWYCIQGKYACRDGWNKEEKKRIHYRMHRAIMNCPEGLEVDHINGDTLDNRKENLRIVTHSINGKNTHSYRGKNKTSKFRGPRWSQTRNFWYSSIMVDGKSIYLGYYDTEVEAALAYNKASKFYDFGFTNVLSIEDLNSIPVNTRKIDKRGKVLFLYEK